MGTHPIFESDFDCLTVKMSRRSSVLAKQNEKELGQSFDELFESYLNKSKYKEAHEFARRRGSKEERDWMLQLIKCEKIYCCELDEYLIPKSWSLWKKQKTAEEQFAMAKTLFEPIDFLVDYCRCRIYLISLFKSLYQAVEKRNFTLPCDFQYIYELYHRVDEIDANAQVNKTMREQLAAICERHGDSHRNVFKCIKIEYETIDHILRAAKDISSLHILPAQVALKQAKFKLEQWKDICPQGAPAGAAGFFMSNRQARFPCSWLGELHEHLLAKFCLFFYTAFTDVKQNGPSTFREQEFSKLAERTRYDFKTHCINFMEKHAARAVYLIRDHNPLHDRQNKYSSTSRYIFLPFVNTVIQEDAENAIGIVSSFLKEPKDSDLDGMLKTHGKYTLELNESQKMTKRNNKASFEEAEDQLILKWHEKSCYHLGQVEATYFLVVVYDRHAEIDEATRALYTDFRKNIRLNHLFKRLVKD